MTTHRIVARRRAFALLLAFSATPAFAARYTYHGELLDGDAPAQGRYDLRLRALAAPDATTALGDATELPAVKVTDGAFALEVELPGNPLGDTVVEVALRRAGGHAPFEVLGAPQPISKVKQGCWALDGNTGVPANRFPGTADPLAGTALELRTRNLRVARFVPGTVGGSHGSQQDATLMRRIEALDSSPTTP
jgi:hypothetical protein